MTTLVLTRADVENVVRIESVVEAVEGAFAAHGRGETLMPVKVYLDLEAYDGDFRAMPAYFDGAAGVKWVNAHPRNPERFGLPAVLGMYILSDPATAQPLAVMDATLLTALRTGAAAAVASRALAKPSSKTLGIVGCGVQARTLLSAHRTVFPSLEVLAADASREAAEAFAREADGRVATLEEACGADIVCTATPVRSPIVQRQWLRPGCHVNAMGADAPGKQELETEVVQNAKVVVDDLDQASHSGEINVPLERGEITLDGVHASLGEIVAGLASGREGDEVTVFDSTGLAVQDVALARVIHEAAREAGVGIEVDFTGVSSSSS